MSFSKKYSVPGGLEQEVLLTWDSGYRNVKLYYEGQLECEIPSPSAIKQGYTHDSQRLGTIDFSFNEKPMYVKLRVNGIVCGIDSIKQGKELEGAASIFWVLFALAIIGTGIEAYQLGLENGVGLGVTIFNALVTSVYALAAWFTAQGKPWAYYMGLYTFLGMTALLVIVNLLASNFAIIVHMLVRGAILYALFGYYKSAQEISGVVRVGTASRDLLDA